MEIEKHNNIRSKQVITSLDTLHSSTTSNNKYKKINDDSLDNDTQNKILSITNTKERNNTREEYNHRNEVKNEKDNNIRSKKVVTSLNNLHSNIKSKNIYRCDNVDELDNDNYIYHKYKRTK